MLVLANIRVSQDAPRHETVEGFEDSRQQCKQEKAEDADMVSADLNAVDIG